MKNSRVIKLNENGVKRIVKECVKRYLKEDMTHNPIQFNPGENDDDITKMVPHLVRCAEYIDRLGVTALGSTTDMEKRDNIERLIAGANSSIKLALEEVGVDLDDYYDGSYYSNQYNELFRDDDDESYL